MIGAAQRRVRQAVARHRLGIRIIRRPEPEFPLLRIRPTLAGVAKIMAHFKKTRSQSHSRVNHALWRQRLGDDGRLAGTKNMRLLKADFLARVTQIILMIEINAGEDGAIGIDDIDRIEPPAQTHLQNHAIGRIVHENQQSCERCKFEIRQCNWLRRHPRRLDLGERR